MKGVLSILVICLLTACVGRAWPVSGAQDPLLYDEIELSRADKLVIFVPGALSSVSIFGTRANWTDAGYGRVYYRYAGLDGLPLDHRVTPESAAERIAAFANTRPGMPVTLVGYSTGGPVALLAAAQISKDRPVYVAALSPAVEYAGGLPTIARGLREVARAVLMAEAFEQQAIWKQFWSSLLYGPAALNDPAFEERLARDIAQGSEVIVDLDLATAMAHTAALPNWRLPADLELTGVEVAFFVGLNDTVFATWQTQDFARKLGGVTIYGYADHGHLLFFTNRTVFDDILRFADGESLVE